MDILLPHFPSAIRSKVNIIERLEFELATMSQSSMLAPTSSHSNCEDPVLKLCGMISIPSLTLLQVSPIRNDIYLLGFYLRVKYLEPYSSVQTNDYSFKIEFFI